MRLKPIQQNLRFLLGIGFTVLITLRQFSEPAKAADSPLWAQTHESDFFVQLMDPQNSESDPKPDKLSVLQAACKANVPGVCDVNNAFSKAKNNKEASSEIDRLCMSKNWVACAFMSELSVDREAAQPNGRAILEEACQVGVQQSCRWRQTLHNSEAARTKELERLCIFAVADACEIIFNKEPASPHWKDGTLSAILCGLGKSRYCSTDAKGTSYFEVRVSQTVKFHDTNKNLDSQPKISAFPMAMKAKEPSEYDNSALRRLRLTPMKALATYLKHADFKNQECNSFFNEVAEFDGSALANPGALRGSLPPLPGWGKCTLRLQNDLSLKLTEYAQACGQWNVELFKLTPENDLLNSKLQSRAICLNNFIELRNLITFNAVKEGEFNVSDFQAQEWLSSLHFNRKPHGYRYGVFMTQDTLKFFQSGGLADRFAQADQKSPELTSLYFFIRASSAILIKEKPELLKIEIDNARANAQVSRNSSLEERLCLMWIIHAPSNKEAEETVKTCTDTSPFAHAVKLMILKNEVEAKKIFKTVSKDSPAYENAKHFLAVLEFPVKDRVYGNYFFMFRELSLDFDLGLSSLKVSENP